MRRLVPVLAFCLAAPAARGAAPAGESARYQVVGPSPWRNVQPVEAAGYRVALSSPDGVTLVATVHVTGGPLRDDAGFPPAAAPIPEDVRALLASTPRVEADVDALSRFLLRGVATQLEAVERVIGYVSRRIRYDLPGRVPESAASCLKRGRGSCVGRSLLAADLLLAAGVPVRQVTGILAASGPGELTPETRQVFNDEISGVRHRWIEVWVSGLGWVPSDPGGLANTVTARHLALPGPPGAGFGLKLLDRTAERSLPRLPASFGLAARGRPRLSPVPAGVELAPLGVAP